MKKTIWMAIPLCVLLLSSSALADSYGPYFFSDCRRDTFGESFKSARDNQILNPQARRNLKPVQGMDGLAAERVYQNYIESFRGEAARGAGTGGPVGYLPLLSAPIGGGGR